MEKQPRHRKGWGPGAALAGCRQRVFRGNGRACPGHPPPRVSRPPPSGAPMLPEDLYLLSGWSAGSYPLSTPPSISGKISRPRFSAPESLLHAPQNTGQEAPGGYLWPWAAEWLKQFISSWREEAMPLASSMLRRGSAPRLSSKLTSS